MEVRINKEVRNYQESLFFGLSLRQFLFALLAVLVALAMSFCLRPVLGTGEIGWGMHPGRVSLCPGRFFHLQRHDPGTLSHGVYPLRISHAQTALIPNGGSLCQTYGTHINKGGHPT